MPHNTADVKGLGPAFFEREAALLREHQKRVTGLRNIFQKLPWLTARSPLGGFETDFVVLHAIMKPPPSSKRPRKTQSADVNGQSQREGGDVSESGSAPDPQAGSKRPHGTKPTSELTATEAKRVLLQRQRREQMRLKRPSSSTRLPHDLSFLSHLASTGEGPSLPRRESSALLSRRSSSISIAMEPLIEVSVEELVEAEATSMARFRQPCERWACDEENLVLNRLVDLQVNQQDGTTVSKQRLLQMLADEFGLGCIQRLRSSVVYTLQQIDVPMHNEGQQARPKTEGTSAEEQGPIRPNSLAQVWKEEQMLSPFRPSIFAVQSPRRRAHGPDYQRDVFVRHVLRMFVPPEGRGASLDILEAANQLANDKLRAHAASAPHPLMHQELCTPGQLSAEALDILERQQALFLTYRNSQKYHRPRCLKDIAQELDDEATMRKITHSVFSEVVTTAADRMAALSDLLSDSEQVVAQANRDNSGGEFDAVDDLRSFEDSSADAAAQNAVRLKSMIAEWERWLATIAHTQAVFSRLGRVSTPIVSPEEEKFIAVDSSDTQHADGDNGQPGHDDAADESDSSFDSNEAVIESDGSDAEDCYFFSSDTSPARKYQRKAAVLQHEVLAFGKRHALACVVDFDIPKLQSECRRAAEAGMQSFRRSVHLLLLVDRLYGSSEVHPLKSDALTYGVPHCCYFCRCRRQAIWDLANEARKSYKEAKPSVFLDSVSKKVSALWLCECMHAATTPFTLCYVSLMDRLTSFEQK